MEKPFNLTPWEIAQIDLVKRRREEQELMLELRRRSGIRYGVCIKQGVFSIEKSACATTRDGRPTGTATVEYVRSNLKQHEVAPAIRELLAAL